MTDDHFVHQDTMERLLDGTSASEFKRRNLAIVIGEVDKEVMPSNTTVELKLMIAMRAAGMFTGAVVQLYQPTDE